MSSHQRGVEPYKWDFIYVGAMDKSRKLHVAIDKIIEYKPDARIVLVGDAPSYLIKRYRNYHIDFTGKIPYTEVPDILKKAKIAINYIPDIYPYNIQTSTKLLEYLASKCLVLTNKYSWVEEYCNERSLSILFFEEIDKAFEENYFSLNELDENQKSVKLWNEVIYDSNIEEYLP
ncbi:glycosyltransferase [Providencia huaxiensis]|uniref:glycosyltransferase n=1 Tax=Providencia huaxiensis TaxID=2027290 RepID=UPI0034E58A4D